MKRFLKNAKEVIFSVVFFSTIYWVSALIVNVFELNKLNAISFIDHLYPTLTFFIIPYSFFYIYIFAGPFYIGYKDETILHKYTTNVVVSSIVGFFIFLIVPTYIDRSEFFNNSFIYNNFRTIGDILDCKCNAIPSFHSLISWLIYISIRELDIEKKYKYFSLLISISICFATFLIRQHGIIDTIFAITLAELINYITTSEMYRKLLSKFQKQEINIYG